MCAFLPKMTKVLKILSSNEQKFKLGGEEVGAIFQNPLKLAYSTSQTLPPSSVSVRRLERPCTLPPVLEFVTLTSASDWVAHLWAVSNEVSPSGI